MSQRSLGQWLAVLEAMHPSEIDMGLERVREVAERLNVLRPAPRVFTVTGTNGKGSTCAALDSLLRTAWLRTGCYTSPHLHRYNERIRINGAQADDQSICDAFAAIDAARGDISLTYFEFGTLAAFWLFQRERLDAVVLEVGLGGRLDAVNVVDADVAVVTSIGLDHQEYLGSTRESVAFEKAGIMRAGRPVVVSDPMPPQSVLDHAQAIGADLWRLGQDFNFSGDKQQWGWAGRGRRYAGLAYPALRGANQLVNASGALAALEAIRSRLPVTAQAVRTGLAMVELPGRFQIIPGQPTLVLDVAHNPHSVAALTANLDAMGYFPCTHAVFGAMHDKDLAPMLARIAPLIDRWYLTDLPTPRAESAEVLRQKIEALPPAPGVPREISLATFANPQLALDAAVLAAGPTDRIVVFGSFFTVGGVLQDGPPRLNAKHLGT